MSDPGRVTIVRAQGGGACPSQWDAWDSEGRYWYLRYRGAYGTAHQFPDPDWRTWDWEHPGGLLYFDNADTDPLDGFITLREFCERAGLALKLEGEGPVPEGTRQEIIDG